MHNSFLFRIPLFVENCQPMAAEMQMKGGLWMKIDEPWEMLADKKIWTMLCNPEQELDKDCIRLMFIELFRRIKNLEHETNTLKVLLFLYGVIEEKVFNIALKEVNDFFKDRDEEHAREIDFFANSGIPFADWAAFTMKGKFDNSLNT